MGHLRAGERVALPHCHDPREGHRFLAGKVPIRFSAVPSPLLDVAGTDGGKVGTEVGRNPLMPRGLWDGQ